MSGPELAILSEYCQACHIPRLHWTSSPTACRFWGPVLVARYAKRLEDRGTVATIAFERGCRSLGIPPGTVRSWARRERKTLWRRVRGER